MTLSIILILSLFLLTLASGFFSGSEIAYFSLSGAKVHTYESSRQPRKKLVARLLSHPRDLLVTIYIYNTLVNILLQNAASTLFGEFAGWTLKVGVPLIIVLFIGEIIPKYVGLKNNTSITKLFAPILNFFYKKCTPVRRLLSFITTPLSRMMFFFLKEEPLITRDELEHALKESVTMKVIHADEAELMSGYLDLREAQIKELMQPREDIIAYDVKQPIKELIHCFVDEECSRVPVYRGALDNIIGIIDAKTFFVRLTPDSSAAEVISYLTKPFFVPETASALTVLKQLDEHNQILALVVDEYGSIAGLISKEDLVEEVIGEITDRRDEKSHYTRASDQVIIASGKMEVDEFEELFDITLNNPNNMVTIGGWITDQMGDIPKAGAYHQTDEFLFHVLAADPNRVRRLYVRQLHAPKEAGQ